MRAGWCRGRWWSIGMHGAPIWPASRSRLCPGNGRCWKCCSGRPSASSPRKASARASRAAASPSRRTPSRPMSRGCAPSSSRRASASARCTALVTCWKPRMSSEPLLPPPEARRRVPRLSRRMQLAALSTLNTARSQLKLAEANEKRQHELYLAKSGALKDWLQSQAELASAQNALRSAETARAAARNRLRILGKSATEIASVENSPNTQQINPEAIVRAPIGGTVVQRQVGLGQYIASAASGASTTPVYSIGDLSTAWLMSTVRETDPRMVRIRQPVDVRVLAYPARVFSAHLAWIAPSIDATTRRLPVRAEVENTDGALKPMMFASFSIITGVDVAAPAIPQNAVIY